MKKIILILIFTFSKLTSFAQVNLINDGSFEDTVAGWTQNFFQQGLYNWESIVNKKEVNPWAYFSKWIDPNFSNSYLPDNPYVRQLPRNGASAIYLINYSLYYFPWGKNSLIKSKLKEKLIAGNLYCATIYIAADERQYFQFTNGLGMYFDNGQLDTMVTKLHDSSGNYTSVKPQVQCNFLINDTINWMKLQGTFVANGTEEYITIGNFLADDSLMIQTNGNYLNIPFFDLQNILIDDVSLIPIDLHDWLHDTFCAIGDSVWVGLGAYDYTDGVWYNYNNAPIDFVKGAIDTSNGFWYKPTQAITQFVQGVEVCGVWVYDTINVYQYPASVHYLQLGIELKIYPNPATETFTVEKVFGTKVQLINMLGEVLMVQEVKNNRAVFNVQGLAKGVYYIRSERQVSKVVVE